METYTYRARDVKAGKETTGEIEAESESVAAKLLNDRGLAPLEIKLKSDKSLFSTWRNRIPAKQRVIFSRQLSTLVNAGLPLVQSLTSVRDQAISKPLKAVISRVISEVESGSSLAEALSHHPRVFDNVYISLVAAGETSGTLDKSLERLANQQEKDAEIISKVRGALIYPIIVILVLIAVVAFMLTTVLPSVETLYQGLPGVQLPFVTRMLLSVSNVARGDWWVIVILVVGGAFFITRYIRTAPGRSNFDRLKLRLPAVGPLYKKLYMARFARISSTLVGSGVPMIQMLNTTATAVDNVHVAAAINKATEQVKGGKALSDSLAGNPDFLDLVPSMIRIGEQSGSLDSMLSRVADYYEKEVDNQIKAVSTVIEPALMVVVGVIALIVVAAVLLPIYSLAGQTPGF